MSFVRVNDNNNSNIKTNMDAAPDAVRLSDGSSSGRDNQQGYMAPLQTPGCNTSNLAEANTSMNNNIRDGGSRTPAGHSASASNLQHQQGDGTPQKYVGSPAVGSASRQQRSTTQLPPSKLFADKSELKTKLEAFFSDRGSKSQLRTVVHYGKTAEFLRNSFVTDKFTDVKLTCDTGLMIPAHKAVLAAHSEHLRDVFIKKPATKTVQIEGTSPQVLQQLVDFMYSGEITITLVNVSEFLSAARLLKIAEVERYCVNLLSIATPENALLIMEIAEHFELQAARKAAYQKVTENFREVTQTEHFVKLDVEAVCRLLSDDNIEVRTEQDIFRAALRWIHHEKPARNAHIGRIMACVRFPLMSTKELLVCSEEAGEMAQNDELQNMLYYANWYHTCVTLGKSTKVNFRVPPPRSKSPMKAAESYHEWDRVHDIRNGNGNAAASTAVGNPNTENYNNASALVGVLPGTSSNIGLPRAGVGAGQMALASPSRQGSVTGRSASPVQLDQLQITQPSFLCVGGFNMQMGDKKMPTRAVDLFHPRLNQWVRLTKLPERRTHHICCYVRGFVYVIGGFNGKSVVNTNFKYDIRENRWLEGAPMGSKRMCHQSCVLDDKIFIVGGQNENQDLLSSIEIYDVITDRWTQAPPMSSGKLGCCVASHLGMVWVVGGYDDVTNQTNPVLKSVDCYDPQRSKWTKRRPLASGRCMAALVECSGSLYLLGGAAKSTTRSGSDPLVVSLASAMIYDDVKDEWREIGQLSEPRYNTGCAVVGSRIYVAGGMNSIENRSLASVECLDVRKGAWIRGVRDIPKLSLGLSCVMVPPITANASNNNTSTGQN